MSTMTLEQVRDELRENAKDLDEQGNKANANALHIWADAIDAHLREQEEKA